MIDLALVHAPGRDHPWGVRAGAAYVVAVGDHCSWNEDDCRRSDAWPLGGLAAHLSWRGGARLASDVEIVAGAGVVDMHQFGFLPMWTALAELGARIEAREPLGFVVGGAIARSLSFRQRVGEFGFRSYGIEPVCLTLEASAVVGPTGLVRPLLGVGPTLSFVAGDYD